MGYSNISSENSRRSNGAAIGNIMAIVHCIGLLAHVDAFANWLRERHHMTLTRELLEGYKFALDVLFGRLFDEIGRNSTLDLEEDAWLSRALFSGISISKVPNSSEKAVLLRNIQYSANHVLMAQDWKELAGAVTVFRHKVLSRFDRLCAIAVPSREYSIDDAGEALNYASIFEAYIFLNDTRRGRPHGLPLSWYARETPLFWESTRQGRADLTRVFRGYKYALQFVWSLLLQDDYDGSILASLHEAQDWIELDEFFDKIRESIIVPMETKTNAHFGFDSTLLLPSSAKRILGVLIRSGPPERRLTQKDRIDRLFFWYDIELIDASDYGFNGVASFVPLLVGSIQMRRELGSNDKLKVVRLVHPPEGISDRHDFSYGMLISLGSTTGLSDYSGWVLFYDCCSDKGSTSPGHAFVETRLDRYAAEGSIDVQETTVHKKQFLKLMRHRLVSVTKQEMFSLRRRTRNKRSQ